MPLYQYRCPVCEDEWDAWHTIDERLTEICCNETASIILSVCAVRPNGITKEKPRIPKHPECKSQIIKPDGTKVIDQAKANSIINDANRSIAKENRKRGYND